MKIRKTNDLVLALAGLALITTACGGDDDPAGPDPVDDGPGTLSVVIQTQGNTTDPDGYSLRLDGGSAQAVDVNETVTFSDVDAGDHTVELTGNDGTCYLVGDRERTATVIADQTTTETFEIVCYLRPMGLESDVPTRPTGGYTKITVVDDDGSFPTTFGIGSVSTQPHWSRAGALAYFVGNETTGLDELRLTVAGPAGSTTDATTRSARPGGWSEDGSRLLINSLGQFQVYDLSTGSFTDLAGLPSNTTSFFTAVAPNGTDLMINPLFFGDPGEIWITDFAGASPTQVGDPTHDYSCMTWSGDGSEVYCTVWNGSASPLVAVDVTDGTERTILEGSVFAALGENVVVSPGTVTPDGSAIILSISIYDSEGNGRSSLYSVEPDGSNLTDVSQAAEGVHDRIHLDSSVRLWSEDTEELAFIRCDESVGGVNCDTALMVMKADGSGMRQVWDIPAAGSGNHAQWIPLPD